MHNLFNIKVGNIYYNNIHFYNILSISICANPPQKNIVIIIREQVFEYKVLIYECLR